MLPMNAPMASARDDAVAVAAPAVCDRPEDVVLPIDASAPAAAILSARAGATMLLTSAGNCADAVAPMAVVFARSNAVPIRTTVHSATAESVRTARLRLTCL